MRGDGRVFLARERGKRLLCSARDKRIDTDDCVLRCKLLVRHFDRAILVEHRLEPVDGLGPSKVLDISPRFARIPGHHDAILEFLHVAIAGHARLEKNANRWNGVNQCRGPFGQRIEAADGNSAIIARPEAGGCPIGGRAVFRCEPNRPGNAD